MSSSFFQKLGRTSTIMSAEESRTSSPTPSASAGESGSGSPVHSTSGTGTGTATPVRRDVRFKTVKVSRQIQRSSPAPSEYASGKSYQLDILKRLNKRKKDRVSKPDKPEVEKKPKGTRDKPKRGSRAPSKAKSSEFVMSDDEESEEEVEEEEEEEEEPVEEVLPDGSDDGSADEEKNSDKRPKPNDRPVDEDREILDDAVFSKHSDAPTILQSADVVTADSPGYEPYFPNEEGGTYIELRYPAMPAVTERFNLLMPRQEDYDPLIEVQHIMQIVAQFFLPEDEGIKIFTADMQDCIIRRIKRAIKRKSLYALKTAVDEYNAIVEQFYDDGNEDIYRQLIISNLRNRSNMATVAHEILSHIYSRIVSPHVKELRKYTAFSNNVYGELLPAFASKLFREVELTSSQVFLDLGSGVGNCVLQAALEVGCESYGCEMMDNAAKLADKQAIEFKQRLKLWGIKTGSVKLITGDFLKSEEIGEILKRTDFLLVNNYAFDAELNGSLINMFLDLREGTKIVSLKSFVPAGHNITTHNVESPINLLKVEEREFATRSVSWTDAPGNYYVSTIDRSRIAKFLKSQE
ncbi:histone methylation protein DOT1-domain-containing protein [Lipomyces kononenkoae]